MNVSGIKYILVIYHHPALYSYLDAVNAYNYVCLYWTGQDYTCVLALHG
jgi:hypothetical protein